MKNRQFLPVVSSCFCVLALVTSWSPAFSATNKVQVEISRYTNAIQKAVQLNWSPARGVLQSAPGVTGPWSNVSADNPSWFFLGAGNSFFRVWDTTNDLITLDPGSDLYQSQGFMPLTLPQNFFGPGSQPFVGTVQLRGVPMETAGAFELGTADTVVHRPDPARFPPPDSTMVVPIQLIALSLVGVNPITVTYPSGPPQQWTVTLQPGALPPAAPPGQMILRRSFSGMTFGLQLPLVPALIFSNNVAGTRTMTLPMQVMQGSNGVCSATGPCATDSIRVPRLPLGFCMQNISVSGSQLFLNLFAPSSAPHPPAEIDPSAMVNPLVASLGRFAVISGGANVGALCVIGPNAFIGPNVVMGTNVLIGGGAVIGAGTIIGDNTAIDDGTHVGINSIIGSGVIIGASNQIGAQLHLGNNSKLGDQNSVGNNVQIGSNVVCEPNVTIGDGAMILNGLFFVQGARVGPFVVQSNSLFLCGMPDGSTVITNSPACEALNGFVFGLLSASNRPSEKVVTVVQTVTNLVWNSTNPPTALTNLQRDVNNAGGATNSAGVTTNSIKDRTYVTDTYDCDDFAGDLEKALQALGYDATFTVYWHVVLNPAWRWWKDEIRTPKYITTAHALTDIHTAGGVLWIEPQTGQVGVNLDFNGDGKTEYDTKHPGEFTDDDARIEVYDSREAAEKAGVVMD